MCFLLGLLFSNTLMCGQIRLLCLSWWWSRLSCDLWSAEAFGNTDPLGQSWMELGRGPGWVSPGCISWRLRGSHLQHNFNTAQKRTLAIEGGTSASPWLETDPRALLLRGSSTFVSWRWDPKQYWVPCFEVWKTSPRNLSAKPLHGTVSQPAKS